MAAPNGYYSPRKVRDLLKQWPELTAGVDELHSRRFDGEATSRRTTAGSQNRHRKAVMVADIRSAFAQLAVDNPRAAKWIELHYADLVRTADIADQEGYNQCTIHRIMKQGIGQLSAYLGYDPAEHEAEEQDAVIRWLERLGAQP